MKVMKKDFATSRRFSRRAFTLIELLVVIVIIGIIAAFTIPVWKGIKAQQYKKVARAEMEHIQTALENFKAQHGVYPPGNQNANSNYTPANDRAQFNQLYYELVGTTTPDNGGNYTTLDKKSSMTGANVNAAYGVGGFMNCTKGSVEDGSVAKNFLPGLSAKQISGSVSNNAVADTVMLITSVGGPETTYQPVGIEGVNPFRYVYPGVNNPGGYDLWVKLSIYGKTYLICNWSRTVPVNSSLP